jgi:hypothetical protein
LPGALRELFEKKSFCLRAGLDDLLCPRSCDLAASSAKWTTWREEQDCSSSYAQNHN